MTLFGLERLSRLLLCKALLLCCALCSPSAFAAMYQVTVDTSSLAGTTGYLDIQLNPADTTAPAATAAVSGLTGDLTLLDSAVMEGDASGSLSGTVTLGNSSAFNDYFQQVEFGSVFSILIDIDGDFLSESSLLGSALALSLYAADGATSLLSSDVSGSLLLFDLGSTGIAYTVFADDNGNFAAQVAPVPLPAGVWLLLSGLLGMARVARRR